MEGVIFLKDVVFYSRHGCFEQERKTGGYYRVNIKVWSDVSVSMKSDKLEDGLNYMDVYGVLEREMWKESHLLENVCYRILEGVGKMGRVRKCWVSVEKRRPPMGGEIGWSGVEMEKEYGKDTE